MSLLSIFFKNQSPAPNVDLKRDKHGVRIFFFSIKQRDSIQQGMLHWMWEWAVDSETGVKYHTVLSNYN